MPSGYTAAIHDGEDISFADFTMQCARAFGALITMRDEPGDAAIPDDFAPSTYHKDALANAQAELANLRSMTLETAIRRADDEYADALTRWEEGRRKRAELRKRYEAMLAQVNEWEPPTAEHVELKAFMVKQLADSIGFDCGLDDERWKPQEQAGQEWLATKIERAHKDIGHHAAEYAQEVARAESRTAWVRALLESLAAHSAQDGGPA